MRRGRQVRARVQRSRMERWSKMRSRMGDGRRRRVEWCWVVELEGLFASWRWSVSF